MISSIQTHVGKVRIKNEDSFYAPKNNSELPKLYIVADGMGGHRGGDIASQRAVEVVSSYINGNISEHQNDEQIKELLRCSINEANRRIYAESLENADLSGMGTTLTMGLFYEDKVYIGHIGDSRAYRIRENKIELLTRDHSLIWQLMEEGKLSAEEMTTHPMKNVITQALGTDELVEPDITSFDVKPGDILVLCTDGLINMLDDEKIKDIVCNNNPEDAAKRLIDSANSRGGTDNITVGIIKVDE